MSFKLEFGHPIGERLREIICYQVNKIMLEISQREKSVDDIIHDMRRRFKKIRSILKLIQENMDKDVCDRENEAFRDMARLFNPIRDAEVLLESFASFQDPHFESIASFLQGHYRHVSERVLGQNQALEMVYKKLGDALKRLEILPIHDQGWPMIGAGLKRTYKKGQETFNQACGLASMTRLHEWRKQVKCLGFQLKLVRSHHPDLHNLFKDFSKLGSLLGTHHDLSMLEQTVLKYSPSIGSHTVHVFLDLLEDPCRCLEQKAFSLGNKLYACSPKYFHKRISSLF